MSTPASSPGSAASSGANRLPVWAILLAAWVIVGLAMGLRQAMGLYLLPMTGELKIGREPFSNAQAIANLAWGVCAVISGAVADRYGAGRVIVFAGLATMAGFTTMMMATSPMDLYLSGILFGIGVAGTAVTALVGAVGRAAPADRRTAAIASLGMAAGVGQLVALPYVHVLIQMVGWKTSLGVLAATCALMIPLAYPLAGKPVHAAGVKRQMLGEAFREAFALPSYWLLVAGFFVCGFHVAFYGVHLPAFVADKGLPAWVGPAAIVAVGICNIIGTYAAGQSGRFIEKRVGLSIIYLGRVLPFLGLLFLPITEVTVIGLSAVLGLFWLSTVPLTSGLVATFFGTAWMSMLFGFVFLSHQVGSFVGLVMAGRVYDATGSYNGMWWISIAMAIFAAAVHWPIRERPVARIAAPASVAPARG